MANRRNDNEGRVVDFRDGQPVYKRISRNGQSAGRGKPERGRPEGGRRYEGRGTDERPRRSGEGAYNRKEQSGGRRGERDERGFERGYRPREEFGGREPRERSYREGYDRTRPDRGSYRGEYDRFRGEPRFDRESREPREPREQREPRFNDERIQRHSDEVRRVRPPREERRHENMKPLPRDEEPMQGAQVPEEELPNIIMGRNPVKEAIKSGRSIDRILVTSEHDGSLNEILDLAYDAKLVVRNVERAKLDEICMPFGHNGRPGNHQGIIAYIPGVEYCELSDILDYAKEKGENPFVVLLDGIEDPHNLGSIIRSAECAGAHGIVITKRRSASVTAAVVKTSAGATEYMRIAKVVNLPVAIERLKEAGVWVAGADMGGEPMYKADLKGPFALVVGAEGTGISRLVKEKCDYIVSVPLMGSMESLNASVAAAVIMYEKVRQEQS